MCDLPIVREMTAQIKMLKGWKVFSVLCISQETFRQILEIRNAEAHEAKNVQKARVWVGG